MITHRVAHPTRGPLSGFFRGGDVKKFRENSSAPMPCRELGLRGSVPFPKGHTSPHVPTHGCPCVRSRTSPYPAPAEMIGEKRPEAGDSLPSGFLPLRGTRLGSEDGRGRRGLGWGPVGHVHPGQETGGTSKISGEGRRTEKEDERVQVLLEPKWVWGSR